MKIIRGCDVPLPAIDRIVAIGVFDGVHRGHQAILAQTSDWAGSLRAESAVVTFDRHPQALFSPSPPDCITSLEQRFELFSGLGLDLCLALAFEPSLAEMEVESFVARILLDYLRAKGVVMGVGQRLGYAGRGDLATMRALGEKHGFETRAVEPIMARGRPISSTALRLAVRRADFAYAEEMLGRPFRLHGVVVHGRERGREIGFPTANLRLLHELKPPEGVYLTRALVRERWWPSLTHIGRRPVLRRDDPEAAAVETVETYLLGFSGELYGEHVAVELIERIRNVAAFRSLGELREQLARDVLYLRERASRTGRESSRE